MKFVDFVSREAIRTSIDVDSKDQVIRAMATALLESGKVSEDQHESIIEVVVWQCLTRNIQVLVSW